MVVAIGVRSLLLGLVYLGYAYGASEYLKSSKDNDPPPASYPVGVQIGPFAKVSGRLFEVNGKTGYFSGIT